jgi:hypothetical protein
MLVLTKLILGIPQPTIAGNDQELIVLAKLVNGHIRERSDDLLLGREVCALLELKVTDSSAECKVAVHTTEVDEATCSANASLLALVLGLVVEGERLCAALDAEN